jgi:hypothetical protein
MNSGGSMRLKLSVAVLGLLMAGSLPALAQTNAQQQQPNAYYAPSAPVYNTGNSVPYYSQQNGTTPIYNNNPNTPTLPMNQMIAGKNAPSYNYNANQAYSFNDPTSLAGASLGSLSPEQANMVRAQRDANAQAYQQAYQQQLQDQQNQQQQMQQSGASQYQGGQFAQLYANATGQQQKPVSTKKRVIYKEMNNPLVAPPRLFNTD